MFLRSVSIDARHGFTIQINNTWIYCISNSYNNVDFMALIFLSLMNCLQSVRSFNKVLWNYSVALRKVHSIHSETGMSDVRLTFVQDLISDFSFFTSSMLLRYEITLSAQYRSLVSVSGCSIFWRYWQQLTKFCGAAALDNAPEKLADSSWSTNRCAYTLPIWAKNALHYCTPKTNFYILKILSLNVILRAFSINSLLSFSRQVHLSH
jgi:hypothetical protein